MNDAKEPERRGDTPDFTDDELEAADRAWDKVHRESVADERSGEGNVEPETSQKP